MTSRFHGLQALLAILLLTALAACSSDSPADTPAPPGEPADPSATVAMTFTASRPTALSRAGGTPLEDFVTSFAVAAWKRTGETEQYVMRHADGSPYQVTRADGAWTYDITALDGALQHLCYWDLSADTYTFAAYTPYAVYDSESGTMVTAQQKHGATIGNDGHLSVTGVKGNVAATGSTEWMTALVTRTASPLADSDALTPAAALDAPAAMTAAMPLPFHRIMSEIEFRAYNTDGTGLLLSQFSVELVTSDTDLTPTTIYTTGDYSSAAWSNLAEPESLIFSGTSLGVTGTSAADASTLGLLVEIPQDVAGRWIKVTVNYGSHVVNGVFQLPQWRDAAETVPYTWEADKKYIYTFTLSASQEIILFDINTEDFLWRPGNDIDVEDPETNW